MKTLRTSLPTHGATGNPLSLKLPRLSLAGLRRDFNSRLAEELDRARAVRNVDAPDPWGPHESASGVLKRVPRETLRKALGDLPAEWEILYSRIQQVAGNSEAVYPVQVCINVTGLRGDIVTFNQIFQRAMIDATVSALQEMKEERGWSVDVTKTPSAISVRIQNGDQVEDNLFPVPHDE